MARPVPEEWLNKNKFKIDDGDDEDVIFDKQVNANIAAEIKPWFFIYRYSQLKAEYDKYEKSVRSNCKIRFGKSLDDLYMLDIRSEEEELFLYNYEKYMPISRAPGTMNRICWKIEDAFQTTNVLSEVEFDYSILKNDTTYSVEEYDAVALLYEEYNKNMQLFLKAEKKNDSEKEDRDTFTTQLADMFLRECSVVCPNMEVLSNILVDVCYTSQKNKSFAWSIAGEQIFQNVLNNNNNIIRFPVKNVDGDIDFCGKKFSICEMKIGGDIDADFE